MRRRIRQAWPLAVLFLAAGCPGVEPSDLAPPPEGEHWLRFVHMTDIHVTDEESPARLAAMDSYVSASWRPQEAFTAQVLDATCRMINRVHYAGFANGHGPVDFVMVGGDVTDCAQYNELRWFIGTMDGLRVTCDSGELDGPNRPGPPEINPNLPFQAAGLAKDIPWYVALGNHDSLAAGNFVIDRSASDAGAWVAPVSPTVAAFLGLGKLTPPQDALSPTGSQALAILNAGDPEPMDPATCQLRLDLLESGPIVADAARHYVSPAMFVDAFFDTRSFPAGHGFDVAARVTGFAWYSVRPVRDVPVRMIVLDSVGPDAIRGYLGPDGAISRFQFDSFLKPEIRKAEQAGEYVLVVTHHPSADLVKPTALSCVTAAEFTGYLSRQPNILAHLCGHVHYEDVVVHEGPYPYPEIITAALSDYPQRVRLIDIYHDAADDTFSLRTTFITHADRPTALSREAFARANADMFFDPESPEWAQRMNHLDLSDLESIAAGKAPRAMDPESVRLLQQPRTIRLSRPKLAR